MRPARLNACSKTTTNQAAIRIFIRVFLTQAPGLLIPESQNICLILLDLRSQEAEALTEKEIHSGR